MFDINGVYWRIFLVSANHPGLQRSDGSFALGMCDNNDKIIYIYDQLDKAMWKKVLCHEVTHAAMFSYQISLSIEQEEIVADLVATYGQEIIHITNLIFNRIKKNKGEF